MEIIQVKNYEELSQKALELVLIKVLESETLTLGCPTGNTPKRLYELMRDDFKKNKRDYTNVITVNLDEYVGINPNNPTSYHYFMNENLFNFINVKQSFIPNGNAKDLNEECERYEKIIKLLGGIDLTVLGLGRNGHIGFNEPLTPFNSKTHIVKLTESTREANSKFFKSIEEVPSHAITMGLSTIMKSKEIILLVSGKEKAKALRSILKDKVTEEIPASILKLHKKITIIADIEAYEYIK